MREVEIEIMMEHLEIDGATDMTTTEKTILQASFNEPKDSPQQITTLKELDEQIDKMIGQSISPEGAIGYQVRVNGLLYKGAGSNEEETVPFYELTRSEWSEVREEFANMFKAYQPDRVMILLDHEIGSTLHRVWEDSNVWVLRDPKAR